MIHEISEQIKNINNALDWVKVNKSEDYQVKFLDLVEQRRKLNMVLRAAGDNPALAAFGKSQVGKSYLMSCILQNKGKAFNVCVNGKEHDFIKEINPIGDDKEATGVVTRFSSFKRKKELYNADYPVLIRCLSVADIVTILSDTYYNDVTNYSTPSESELMDECERLKEKYSSKPEIDNPIISADDILVLKKYFKKHINNAQVFNNSSFFNELALIIERIPVDDYVEVFRLLWHSKESEKQEEHLTKIFRILLQVSRRIGFSEYLYLPIDAVLHEGIKQNTVMSVECLKHLLDVQANLQTEVFVKDGTSLKRMGVFTKSEICGIASEAIFRISDDFIASTDKYCLDGIDDAIKPRVKSDEIEMAILENNDLLDFPGARSREKEDCKKLSEDSVLLNCFLRGKVAYLFNKYNESLAINVLLYCHHNKDNDVTELWHLLNEWVETYVGKDPEKRKRMLEKTNISPLFYIATMFNLDMKPKESTVENSRNAIENRWTGRFETVLFKQCFHRDTVEWVKNWTGVGSFFKNSYLLRDYKYSGPKSSQLYEGFDECGREQSMLLSGEYYRTLRDTFVNNAHVRDLFEQPELAWDLATTINNDGSLYIIERLSIVASRMWEAREQLFKDILEEATKSVNDAIKDYYISTDINELLETNIRKAKCVLRELSFTCNNDNYYFGHLIQALQVTEPKCYQIIHEIMQDSERLNRPNQFRNYEIIMKDCEQNGSPLSKCNGREEQWEAVVQTYGFSSQMEAENYLNSKGVDPDILFKEEYTKLLNSNLIAGEIYDAWCNGIKSVDFMTTFTGDESFNSTVMSGLVDNIIAASKRIDLCGRMACDIAEYVDGVDVHLANESFLADILSDAINDFVLDLGFSTFDEGSVQSVRKLSESRKLPIFKYICKPSTKAYDEAEFTELFDNIYNNPTALVPSFEDHYYQWIEYLYISYIAHLEVPDFNPAVNEQLKLILDGLEAGKCVVA